MKWAGAPGNVVLPARATGLPKPSVANVSLIVALDKRQLIDQVGKVGTRQLELLFAGIDMVLGR